MYPKIVNYPGQSHRVVAELIADFSDWSVLGFDTESHGSYGFGQRSADLLQLASCSGTCGLFRLNKLNHVPYGVQDLLDDPNVLKLGVVPESDAKLLWKCEGVDVSGTLDLRHIGRYLQENSGGLKKMAQYYLGETLDKSLDIVCSDWAASYLTDRQVDYAAKDAYVAVEIFEAMFNIYCEDNNCLYSSWAKDQFMDICYGFADQRFK